MLYFLNVNYVNLGVCSEYLRSLSSGDEILYAIRRGSVLLPEDKPIVMVGPGTGVAPMRAVIHERLCRSSSDPISSDIDTLLFFGCRRKNCDFLFEDEWKSTAGIKLILNGKDDLETGNSVGCQRKYVGVIPAFSREQVSKQVRCSIQC